MTLIVHGAVRSATERVLVTLEELNVDYKLNVVSLGRGDNMTPDYLKLQPFGLIPVLQDGDYTIFETRAIMRYLCEKFPEQGTPLLGHNLQERGLVSQWLEVESQNYTPLATAIFMEKMKPMFSGRATNEEVVAADAAKLEKVLDVYEAHLAKSKFLAGNFFSLADLSHMLYTDALVKEAGMPELITSRPHVSAWWSAISQRPAFQKVLARRPKWI